MDVTSYSVREYCYIWKCDELFQSLQYINPLSTPTTYVSATDWIKLNLDWKENAGILKVSIDKNDELEVALGECEIEFGNIEYSTFVISKRRCSNIPGWTFELRPNLPIHIRSTCPTITCHLFLGERTAATSQESTLRDLHLMKLSRDMNRLYTTGLHSDLTLAVGGETFRCHKAILLARAPELFRTLNLGTGSNCTRNVDEIRAPVLQKLLAYWYSGEIDVCQAELPIGFCTAVETLKLDDLKRKTCVYPTQSSTVSRIKTESHDFTWPVKNFMASLSRRVVLTSPVLYTSRFSDIQLKLLLQTSTDSDGNEVVSIKIHRVPDHDLINASLHIETSIVNAFGEFTRKNTSFADNGVNWHLVNKIKKSDLECDRDILLPGGTLSLRCKITLRKSSYEFDQTAYSSTSTEDHSVRYKDLSHLSNCLSSLYSSNGNSDLVLKSGNREFRVHKSIINARAPKYFEMLQTLTPCGSSNLVLKDIEPGIVNKFLLYIYSGKIDFLDCGTATKLYIMSYNYELPLLKDACLSFIRSNLIF